ncbi:unnamed protein product [Penicillium salamii]|uniref:Uncharacterized protein n=1 Tax=Penicillium salamii TaxID=1612424 RepID=A0A9W4P0C1_9EURO|nr:unnamed protein product [Penicillium salamii]CAG8138069.1 unnamed protein product [Penicillium salamii]CAG8361923.1 unnamed protein product [Penicillium salamii]CAG8408071.1 unnamed protein product [Penicillium salamii]CAG8410173.1 unnamed protein product [Penicillium salamii]
MASTSPPWEERGLILQRWIEGRQSGCPYPKSVFTLAYKSRDYLIVAKQEKLNAKLLAFLQIGNTNSTFHNVSVTQRDVSAPTWWIGRIAPGMVIVDDIFRSKRSDDPYISEFTKAVYQLEFPLNSLKSVVVANINEKDTVHCARHKVYKSQGLQYPSRTQHIWNSSSHEFQALLGTGIGKVVGAFVLCAWGQGRKRISRIVTFNIDSDVHKLHMRFDLEDM